MFCQNQYMKIIFEILLQGYKFCCSIQKSVILKDSFVCHQHGKICTCYKSTIARLGVGEIQMRISFVIITFDYPFRVCHMLVFFICILFQLSEIIRNNYNKTLYHTEISTIVLVIKCSKFLTLIFFATYFLDENSQLLYLVSYDDMHKLIDFRFIRFLYEACLFQYNNFF